VEEKNKQKVNMKKIVIMIVAVIGLYIAIQSAMAATCKKGDDGKCTDGAQCMDANKVPGLCNTDCTCVVS
jgi:hypothetical protein